MASAAGAATRSITKLCFLDLRATGLSVIERLCLEEAVLRHDPLQRSWAIVGTHEPLQHRYLTDAVGGVAGTATIRLPDYVRDAEDPNRACIVVMGIGGKPGQLLNIDKVKEDGVVVIKRFSGGGTVVLDQSSIWTTFIGRTKDFPHVDPYPRSIMQWSADEVFTRTFATMGSTVDVASNRKRRNMQQTLVVDTKSCSASENSGRQMFVEMDPGRSQPSLTGSEDASVPEFLLRENDYVLGERKMGGNAQSIVKGGWLHHTSFLWDYDDENMEYLSLPSKRPEYRGNRSHNDFLVRLSEHYGRRSSVFYDSLQETCEARFDVEKIRLNEAMEIVDELGGMNEWFDKSRTRIVEDF